MSSVQGTVQNHLAAWQQQLELLLRTQDTAGVAAHLVSLDELGLEPTAKARVLAESMVGSQTSAARSNAVESGMMRELAQRLGTGLLGFIRGAQLRTGELDELYRQQQGLAAGLEEVGRGELAQSVAAYLRAKHPGGITAVNVAGSSSEADRALLFLSNGNFVLRTGAAGSMDKSYDYYKPTAEHLSRLGVTAESLGLKLVAMLRSVAQGQDLELASTQDLPRWQRLSSNVVEGRSTPLPPPTTEAATERARLAIAAQEARISALATAQATLSQLDRLFRGDAGVRELVAHLRAQPDGGKGVGLEIAYGLVLTTDGFRRTETTDASRHYKRRSLYYVDRRTEFSALNLEHVLDRRYTPEAVDQGLAKLMQALVRYHEGSKGEMSWLVRQEGIKADCISE